MTNMILSAPWWVLLTLLVVGGVVAWSGNQRGERRTRNIGLGMAALAVALFVLDRLVETDQATVARLNRELVQSVPDQNWTRMADLLDPDATMATVSMTMFDSRAAIVAGAKADVARWGLKSVSITGTDVKQDAGGITVDIRVISRADVTDMFGSPTPSDWRMEWDRDDKQAWHCHKIICLGIGPEKSASVGRYFR